MVLLGDRVALDVHSVKIPLCDATSNDSSPANHHTSPKCISRSQNVFGYNPGISDKNNVIVRVSPYNMCNANVKNNIAIDVGSDEFRKQSISVWLSSNVVQRLVYDSEDARLFKFRNKFCCMFTRNARYRSNLVFACIDTSVPYYEVVLQYANARRIEKNWVVNAENETLYVSYELNPHVVLSVNVQTGICTEMYRTVNPTLPRGVYRGGSQFVRCDSGLLAVLHRTRVTPGWPGRVYDHAFYLADPNPPFGLLHVSEWFRFPAEYLDARDAIQFCCGCALQGDELLISYGVADCVGRILKIPMRVVLDMLTSAEREVAQGLTAPRA